VKVQISGTTLDQNCITKRLRADQSHRMLATIWFSLLVSCLLSRVVLYGCETWSLTLREGHGLSVFQNRVLWGITGPKRDAVMGDWRKLHNEELQNLYSSPDIIRQTKPSRMR
jgi:hypothetical protein